MTQYSISIDEFLKLGLEGYTLIPVYKEVLADLEKRCHYHSTTNVKGDSHESAYMEGQRSVLLFIKSMLRKENEKGK